MFLRWLRFEFRECIRVVGAGKSLLVDPVGAREVCLLFGFGIMVVVCNMGLLEDSCCIVTRALCLMCVGKAVKGGNRMGWEETYCFIIVVQRWAK